jgi:hypothetical protein
MDNDRTRSSTLPSSVDGGPLTTTTNWSWCGAWAICNVAFLAVVGWLTIGRDQPWWMGLAWSAGYQAVWFVVAYGGTMMGIRSIDPPVPEQEAEAMVDEKMSGGTAHDDKSMNQIKSTRLALLYGLLVTLFLAVLGWQLPRHAIDGPSTSTDTDRGYYYDGIYMDASASAGITTTEWTTDITRLPVRVQEWWTAASSTSAEMDVMNIVATSPPNLVYLPGSKTTIFTEWGSPWYSNTATVWSVSPAAPEPVALWTTNRSNNYFYGRGVMGFVRVHDTLACFVTSDDDSTMMNDITDDNDNNNSNNVIQDLGGNTVACTDGTVVTTATVTAAAALLPAFSNVSQQRTGPRNLFVDHHDDSATTTTTTTTTTTVWFIDYYLDALGKPRSDPLLYSLNPATMEITLHSEPHIIYGDDVLVRFGIDPSSLRGDRHHHHPTRAWGSMFVTMIVTALPAMVSSLYLFGRQQQQQQDGPMTTLHSPSHHHLHLITVLVTLLAGLSTLFLVLGYESSRLDNDNDYGYYYHSAKGVFLWCWTMGVGGAVTLFCTVLLMTNDRDRSQNNNKNSSSSSSGHKNILWWGRNIGALVYFYWGGAVILLSPYGDMTRNAFLWIVFNAVIIAPLTVLGLISQSLFLLLLAAVGVLLDARHICLEYTRHVLRHAPWSIKALITVAIMGGTGMILTIAITYWWLRHRYPDVLTVLIASLEPYCACVPMWCRHRRDGTTVKFTIVPSRDADEDDKDIFDYQQAPPIAAAAAVSKEGNDAAVAKAAATTGGMESLANMLRQWADIVDQVRLAHTAAPESGNQGATVE